MGRCRFAEDCPEFVSTSVVCSIDDGIYYSKGRQVGCYRIMESQEKDSWARRAFWLIYLVVLAVIVAAAYWVTRRAFWLIYLVVLAVIVAAAYWVTMMARGADESP